MKRQDSKICVVCNRPMTWRRKWAKTWELVKYCSNACRRNKPKAAAVGNLQAGPAGQSHVRVMRAATVRERRSGAA